MSNENTTSSVVQQVLSNHRYDWRWSDGSGYSCGSPGIPPVPVWERHASTTIADRLHNAVRYVPAQDEAGTRP